MSAFQEFDELCERFEDDHENGIFHELSVTLEASTVCMWSCEVRYNPLPNRKDGADLSYVAFVAGGHTAEQALAAAMRDLTKWRNEGAFGIMPGESMHEWPTWRGMGLRRGNDGKPINPRYRER